MKRDNTIDLKEELGLWSLYKAGNSKAFRQLYDRYYAALSNYGLKFTLDKPTIEEGIQDLFLKLWEKRADIVIPNHIKYYLYQSFRRILVRKIAYSPSRKEDDLSDEHVEFSLELNFEHDLIRKERAVALKAKVNILLNHLTNRQREAIFLKYYEELSYQEIADIMEMNVGGTYKLIYRAIERLQEQFGNNTLMILLYLLKRS